MLDDLSLSCQLYIHSESPVELSTQKIKSERAIEYIVRDQVGALAATFKVFTVSYDNNMLTKIMSSILILPSARRISF